MDRNNILLRSIPLTVTTRGIGIAIANIDQESVNQFHYQYYSNDSSGDEQCCRRSENHPSIYALYRASLALLETKLNLISFPPFTTIYKEKDVNNNLFKDYHDINAYKVPTPIAKIIDAIGVVQCGDRAYHPVVAAPVFYESGRLMPRSENVLLSTLRQTVEALADPDTPPADRGRFKRTCPIPGAVWNEDDTLSNPDDIIPQDYYTNKNLQDKDLRELHHCTQMYWRNTYVSGKYLDTSLNGRKSLLVSCKLVDLRMNPHNQEETTCSYSYQDNSKCDISSPEPLSYRDQLEGLHNLLGEVPEFDQHDFDQHDHIYYPRYAIKNIYHSHISGVYYVINRDNLEEREMLRRSIPLTITSRGIGFTVAQLIRELGSDYIHRRRDVSENFICKLYRVSLGLFECRLRTIQKDTFSTVNCTSYTREEYILPLSLREERGSLPKCVINIINAIGVVRCGDRAYHPVVAAPVFYENGKLMPRSENILMSTLRQTVEALADPATPLADRGRFKETCPIPGAIWNDDNTLSNPDDIIPQDYTHRDEYLSNFQNDMSVVENYLNDKFWGLPSVNSYLNKEVQTGDKSMLSSNALLEMRVSPRHRDEPLDVYSNRCRVEGEMSEYFTSPVHLNTTQQVNGLFYLLGEVPTDHRTHYKYIYVPREQLCHSFGVHRHVHFNNLYTYMRRLELEEMQRENSDTVKAGANRSEDPRGGRRRRRGRGRRNPNYQ